MLSRRQTNVEGAWRGMGMCVVLALSLGLGACKRDRSDTPAPDPLTSPIQSAPATTELAPIGQATDVPAPTVSAPPPANQGTGTGSGTKTTGSTKKKEEKKEEGEDKSCFSKCQSAFMTCMTPKTSSGGFPQPPDPEACRTALQSCQGACQ